MTAIAVTIAGSDSGGGAGIQADLKTFSALGVYGVSVIAALTAQNTRGVSGIHDVPPEFVTAQIDAVFSDLDVGAEAVDLLVEADGIVRLAAPRAATRNTHGTGCTLSSAIAAGLARELTLPDAVRAAKNYVTAAIAAADLLNIGHGHGPVHHF